MGRFLLVLRLAAKDLQRRPAQAALLLLAITSATAALTLGLVMHGVSDQPYQRTRAATSGPDVIASVSQVPWSRQPADRKALESLADDPQVADHSGPYPYTSATIGAHGVKEHAWVQGRGQSSATVDQPLVTNGSWVTKNGAVLEAGFADALGVGVGDRITVNRRSFRVAGIAVSAATGPYPKACLAPCRHEASARAAQKKPPPLAAKTGPPPANAASLESNGLVWLTDDDLRSLVPSDSLSYVMNVALTNSANAQDFVDKHYAAASIALALTPWQDVLQGHAKFIEKKQTAMLVGSWLLSLLAVASIAVLVGGRMADQVRRVGLLKAVGGTPSLVATVLLAEYVAVALIGSACGLTIGRLVAPWLASSSAGLLGGAGALPFSLLTVVQVTAVALGIACVATFVPAVRAARTSTDLALSDAARPPRRTSWLVTISTRLPVPLLLALRVAGRRPRRILLNVVGIAITVTGTVAVLAAQAHLHTEMASGVKLPDLTQALQLVAITLIAQACVALVCLTWATAVDSRYSTALTRALGATPGQVSAGLSAAQALPALVGTLVGLAGGIGLAEVLDDDPVTLPSPWQLFAVVLGFVALTVALTHLPARVSARRPAGHILQSEHV